MTRVGQVLGSIRERNGYAVIWSRIPFGTPNDPNLWRLLSLLLDRRFRARILVAERKRPISLRGGTGTNVHYYGPCLDLVSCIMVHL